jgi:methylated-DNA-protein-cysteine methyltransferase related protein
MKQPTFREKVYKIAATIPAGKVVTYGQLAALAGSPKAARAAGMCMKLNTNPTSIPCHRVVSSTGKLVDYAFGGTLVKKEKLMKEGIIFKGEKIDLKAFQWNPSIRI